MFDNENDPTEETLMAIKKWRPNFNKKEANGGPWSDYIQFCKEAWNKDYGAIREEFDKEGVKLLCFITGGWSANEAVQGAMMSNVMFKAMCWHSSYRGGMVKYIVQ